MKKVFTREEILSKRGCYEREDVLKLSFINYKVISLIDIINSEIPLKYKRWFIYNNSELTTDQKKELALKLAWTVLPIYEGKYANDSRVRDCLQAIEDFKEGKISIEVLREKRDAAADADAYAADAYAAAAAAYASADDAASAADDAADVAYAAAAVAAAVAAAAYAADAYAYAAVAAADDAAYAAADAADAYAAYAAAAIPSYSDKLLSIIIAFINQNK